MKIILSVFIITIIIGLIWLILSAIAALFLGSFCDNLKNEDEK